MEYFDTACADKYKMITQNGEFVPPVNIKTKLQNATVTDMMMYKMIVSKISYESGKRMNSSRTKQRRW